MYLNFKICFCLISDGKGLLGRSDLTGRYWNGLAQTVDNPEDLLKISDENLICPSMMGQNGLSDGRFMLDTTKVCVLKENITCILIAFKFYCVD